MSASRGADEAIVPSVTTSFGAASTSASGSDSQTAAGDFKSLCQIR